MWRGRCFGIFPTRNQLYPHIKKGKPETSTSETQRGIPGLGIETPIHISNRRFSYIYRQPPRHEDVIPRSLGVNPTTSTIKHISWPISLRQYRPPTRTIPLLRFIAIQTIIGQEMEKFGIRGRSGLLRSSCWFLYFFLPSLFMLFLLFLYF